MPKELRLIVVDDDELILQAVKIALPEQWSMEAIVGNRQRPPTRGFQAALVDMHLSGNTANAEGIEVIRSLRKEDPHIEIVAMSGNLDRDLMERSLKAGASRFLAKPLNIDELLLTLEKIEALLLLQGAMSRSRQSTVHWIGSGRLSQAVKRQIADLKGEAGPILIEGESGTGKEVTAQLLQEQEPNGPFITLNIAAIPENLFESELFGHVRGAFTGADQNKMGLAEAAHSGCLFLDEIEALPLNLQVKLLRFLETGEVRRVGSKDSIRVNVKVIAASNRNLESMVKQGQFREDLLWRLSGKRIVLPPLRERGEDVPDLVGFFLEKDRVRRKQLTPDALELFQSYSWPGNIRELRRVCEHLLVSSPLPLIRSEDVLKILEPKGSTSSGFSIDYSRGLSSLINEYEKQIIAKCLEQYNDIDEASRLLQVSRSSLYKKLKDHGIDWKN